MSDLELTSRHRPGAVPGWQAWLETAALCALAVAAGAIADGHTTASLSSRRGFAWFALAPLLAGLRHGAGRGVACGAAQAGALAIAVHYGRAPPDAPLAEIALGWMVAGLVPGQFRDAWTRRLRAAEGEAGELRFKLGAFVQGYHAMKVSHDRLQREVPGSPVTLHDALEAFQRELGDRAEPGPVEAFGGRVLALFRDCASVRAATLHPVDRHGAVGPAAAALGPPGGGEGRGDGDLLLREAVRLGQVVSVQEVPAGRDVLAAVPLVDMDRRVHAVVAIRDLPFLALQDDTLTLLAVLGGYAGAVLARGASRPSATAALAAVARPAPRPALPAGHGTESPARDHGRAR